MTDEDNKEIKKDAKSLAIAIDASVQNFFDGSGISKESCGLMFMTAFGNVIGNALDYNTLNDTQIRDAIDYLNEVIIGHIALKKKARTIQ